MTSPDLQFTKCSVLSYVYLCDSYSVHSIEMDAGVTQVFERAIIALSRREDPSDTMYVPPLLHC